MVLPLELQVWIVYTPIKLKVVDDVNAPVSADITIEIIDTTNPTLATVHNKTILWPAKHNMVAITIDANAADKAEDAVLHDYSLSPAKVRWHYLDVACTKLTAKPWWPQRDRTVIDLADTLYPVSVRSKGLLADLMKQSKAQVERRFSTDYKPRAHNSAELVDISRLDPGVESWPDDYLIHWTRASHGPWPGEATGVWDRCRTH